jgi:hypothetical protein
MLIGRSFTLSPMLLTPFGLHCYRDSVYFTARPHILSAIDRLAMSATSRPHYMWLTVLAPCRQCYRHGRALYTRILDGLHQPLYVIAVLAPCRQYYTVLASRWCVLVTMGEYSRLPPFSSFDRPSVSPFSFLFSFHFIVFSFWCIISPSNTCRSSHEDSISSRSLIDPLPSPLVDHIICD